MRVGASLIVLSLVFVVGCSTDRRYTVTHDRMVDAAIAAISDEAYVHPDNIQRVEKEEGGGRITTLCSRYNQYSDVKVNVNSTKQEKHCHPELQVEIITPQAKVAKTDIIFTRHKEWEQRIHEQVRLKLLARRHGEESKPTSLPASMPPTPEAKPKL